MKVKEKKKEKKTIHMHHRYKHTHISIIIITKHIIIQTYTGYVDQDQQETDGNPNHIQYMYSLLTVFCNVGFRSLCREDFKCLFDQIKEAASRWRNIGENLEFDFEKLEEIDKKFPCGEDYFKLQHILFIWLKKTEDKTTVSILAHALHNTGYEKLSEDLLNKYRCMQPLLEKCSNKV